MKCSHTQSYFYILEELCSHVSVLHMLFIVEALKEGKKMTLCELETSLYRHRNFVIFRGTKRDKKSHIYKSSAINIKQRTLHKV